MKFKFVWRFHHCLNVRKRSSEKNCLSHFEMTLKMNVFGLHLKVSKLVSLREIGKEFQSRGVGRRLKKPYHKMI
jgi:hypothetical protein